jgi:hypothetical protein
MDYMKHETIEFNHKLYGKAYLMPNSSFKKSTDPQGINYLLPCDMRIRTSGIEDCGIGVDIFILKQLGY